MSPYPMAADPIYPAPEISPSDIWLTLLLELTGRERWDHEVIEAYRDLIPNIIQPGPCWN
jgi:hypothetical protein